MLILALFGIDFMGLDDFGDFLPFSARWFHIAAVALFLLELIVSGVMVQLDYRQRWYIITDRSLRIREGIKTVREMTISLANIQHIALRQGPLQRLVGIADVEVRTAGGGSDPHDHKSESASMHLGRLRGIADASAVRDLIVDRWRALRKAEKKLEEAPIVDPFDSVDPAAALLAAGRALEAEAQALGGWVRSTEGYRTHPP